MTKPEFGRQYDRLEAAYGRKPENTRDKHLELWWLKYGGWPCDLFSEAVDLCLDNHRAFGSDKWPTPGDFNHICSQHPSQICQEDNKNDSDPRKTQYSNLLWRIQQLPIQERNRLLRDAINLIHTRNVPDYMKPLAGPQPCEMSLDAMIQNVRVRLFCKEEGIPFPLDRRSP